MYLAIPKTYIKASTSCNTGAVQPRISPGDKGFERGIVGQYAPDQSLEGCDGGFLIETSGLLFSDSNSTERSSFKRYRAATNWIVETNASRVGSLRLITATGVDDPFSGRPSIRKWRLAPILEPAEICLRSSSADNNSS